MNRRQAEEKIITLLEGKDGGHIQAHSKLIPRICTLLREDPHANWDAIHRALMRLSEAGVVQLEKKGSVLTGVKLVTLGLSSSTTPPTPSSIEPEQKVAENIMTETVQTPSTVSDPFAGMEEREQLTLVLQAFQEAADTSGLIEVASAPDVLVTALGISRTSAVRLNTKLGKLGLRKSAPRYRRHHVDVTVKEVTADMLLALDQAVTASTPPRRKTAKQPVAPEVASSDSASSSSTASTDATEVTSAPEGVAEADSLTPVTSVVELEKSLVEIIKTLQGALETAGTQLAGVRNELATAERNAAKVAEERDEFKRQLDELRKVAVQPLKLQRETRSILKQFKDVIPTAS